MRLSNLKGTLKSLLNQTYNDFNIHISNGNLTVKDTLDGYVQKLGSDRITVSHDGNSRYTFRRFDVCKRLAEAGTEIVLFIDDDVLIPNDYVEQCLNQYEPQTYKSNYAWNFQDGGSDYYYKRTRRYDNEERIHYCGTAASMVDASIFLIPGVVQDAPESSLKIEDLWMSYYADHILGWKLSYMNLNEVSIGGSDNVSLARQVLHDPTNKATFLKELVATGWDLST